MCCARRGREGWSGRGARTLSVLSRQCGSASSAGHAPALGCPSTRKILYTGLGFRVFWENPK